MTSQRPLASALDKVFPHLLIFLCGLGAAVIYDHHWSFRGHGDSPILDLVEDHYPTFYKALTLWHYLPPVVAVLLAGLLLLSVYRVWIATDGPQAARGALPSWPLSPDDDTLRVVIGETHHPVQAKESSRPGWLTLPEKGLFTGLAIFGAVGSGKTSACMYPFAQQILSWQAKNSQRRAAGLVLEVKGDFCHSIQKMLAEVGREEDYTEIGLSGRWQWNPLAPPSSMTGRLMRSSGL